MEVLVIKAI